MTIHRVPKPGRIADALTIPPFKFDEQGYTNKLSGMDAKALLYEFEQVLIEAPIDKDGPAYRRVTLCRREVARRINGDKAA